MTLDNIWKQMEAGRLDFACELCGHTSTDIHFEMEFLKPVCNDKDACRNRAAVLEGRESQTLTSADTGTVEDVFGMPSP